MSNVPDGVTSAESARGPVSRPASPAAQHTVLVIDDEEIILNLMRDILGTRYRVCCALNTREADAILREHPVHAVVCDLNMPGENGLDFLLRLRQASPLISRLLLTGCDEPESILTAINQCGVQRYLVKPIHVAELRQAVDEAVLAHDAAARHAGLGKENADLRQSLQKLLSRSISLQESPVKVLAFFALGVLGVLIMALLLGLLVLLTLYALKSALGIDLIPDWHLMDLL